MKIKEYKTKDREQNESKEILECIIKSLDKVEKELSLSSFERKEIKEKMAGIIFSNLKENGIKVINENSEEEFDLVSTIMLLKAEIEIIKELVERIDERVQILEKDHEHLAEGIKASIREQGKVGGAIIDVIKQEGESTRREIRDAEERIKERMSDHFYNLNRLLP